jgi:hypothetical protein
MVDVHIGKKTVLHLFVRFSVVDVCAAALHFHHSVWLCLSYTGGVLFYLNEFFKNMLGNLLPSLSAVVLNGFCFL